MPRRKVLRVPIELNKLMPTALIVAPSIIYERIPGSYSPWLFHLNVSLKPLPSRHNFGFIVYGGILFVFNPVCSEFFRAIPPERRRVAPVRPGRLPPVFRFLHPPFSPAICWIRFTPTRLACQYQMQFHLPVLSPGFHDLT